MVLHNSEDTRSSTYIPWTRTHGRKSQVRHQIPDPSRRRWYIMRNYIQLLIVRHAVESWWKRNGGGGGMGGTRLAVVICLTHYEYNKIYLWQQQWDSRWENGADFWIGAGALSRLQKPLRSPLSAFGITSICLCVVIVFFWSIRSIYTGTCGSLDKRNLPGSNPHPR